MPFGDVLLPVCLPLVIALLQTMFWEELQAYAWLIYFPGVVLTAWLCGVGGGLLAITLSLAFVEGVFLVLGDQIGQPSPESRALAALLFSLLSLAPVLLLQRFRSERAALHEALTALRMRSLLHTSGLEDDGSDLALLRRLHTELMAREHALAANPFPLALFGGDGRCLYAAVDFGDQLGLSHDAVMALNLLADTAFPLPGVPAAARQLLKWRAGDRNVITVNDGCRRCQLRLVVDMPSPGIMLSLHEDAKRPYAVSSSGGPDPSVAPEVLHALLDDLPSQTRQPQWSTAQPAAPTLSGLRCLVVDDHQINRQLMSELLALEGVAVTLANNGLQAVSAVKTNPHAFDVVLMDLQMPGLDGYGAARQIRNLIPAAELPIFAITADGASVDLARLHAAGMQDLLHKPIDHVALLAVLQPLPHRAQG